MIYGPVVMNAEVISYKDSWEKVETVGISQGRQAEKKAALESYPQIREFQEVTQKGILYTLEDGQTDAVIQDLIQLRDHTQRPVRLSKKLIYDESLLTGTGYFADGSRREGTLAQLAAAAKEAGTFLAFECAL